MLSVFSSAFEGVEGGVSSLSTTSPSVSAAGLCVCVLCVDTQADTVLTETITVEDVFRAQL